MYKKEIVYNREDHDYAMYLDGELIGFARTYHEAEVKLDELVWELTKDDRLYLTPEYLAAHPRPALAA